MGGIGTKLHKGRIRLDMRKNLFTMRVVKCQNRLLREVVDALCLSVFKMPLNNTLKSML